MLLLKMRPCGLATALRLSASAAAQDEAQQAARDAKQAAARAAALAASTAGPSAAELKVQHCQRYVTLLDMPVGCMLQPFLEGSLLSRAAFWLASRDRSVMYSSNCFCLDIWLQAYASLAAK